MSHVFAQINGEKSMIVHKMTFYSKEDFNALFSYVYEIRYLRYIFILMLMFVENPYPLS